MAKNMVTISEKEYRKLLKKRRLRNEIISKLIVVLSERALDWLVEYTYQKTRPESGEADFVTRTNGKMTAVWKL